MLGKRGVSSNGTINKGVLAGFSGKVGKVVGVSWKGISYMRSLPEKFEDPRTPAQLSHRSKFALTINFLKPLHTLLRTGWKLYTDRQTPMNAAVSYTFANAIAGTYPDYYIDPSKVLISRGGLTPAVNAKAAVESGAIHFMWEDNSGVNSAKQTDKALIAIVNIAKGETISDSEGAERLTGTQTVALPADWVGDTVEAYLGFVSEDGSEVANSVRLGSITVV